jgi:hypothetical protein
MISKVDFVGIPSQDAGRSRRFYVETLGLRPDNSAERLRAPASRSTSYSTRMTWGSPSSIST